MSDHTMCPGCHQLRYWTDFDARCSQCRQPTPSSGEETESSPPEGKMQELEFRLAVVESWIPTLKAWQRLGRIPLLPQALEPGPQSPLTTASSTTPTPEAPSDAEPCQGWAPSTEVAQGIVQEPGSPSESTVPVTPSSSLSGQPTTQIFLVEPGCGCAPAIPIVAWMHPPQHQAQVTGRCPTCDALWFRVVIRARDAPASPSGST